MVRPTWTRAPASTFAYLSLLASAGITAFLFGPPRGLAQSLGSAQSFAVVGGSSVTAAGTGTIINGDVGVSPGTSITGFPPATVVPPFTTHANDGAAIAAQSSVAALYASLDPGSCSSASLPQLSGATFTPGTYCFSSTADLAATGDLTLDGAGTYIFQVGSALTANVLSTVTLLNGADPCNVFWQITSAATLNGINFAGNVVAQAGVTVGVGASLTGRALTTAAGAVTMAGTNTIGGCSATATPIATSTSTETPTLTPTDPPTATPTITNTPTLTPTDTPTSTATNTPTTTPTTTSTATPSATPAVVDFGDAPDATYATSLANNGARHVLGTSVYLGSCVDAEIDGQPSAMADGDDNATATTTFGICSVPGDDEDGVILPSHLVTGSIAVVDVIANAACLLSAWMDWNADGDWNDVGEQIFTDQLIAAGTNNLSVAVPSGGTTGDSFARFRCSIQAGLAPTGQADDGEAEDYKVTILSPTAPPTNTPTDTSTPRPTGTPTNPPISTHTPTRTATNTAAPFTTTPTPTQTATLGSCIEPALGPAQDANVFVIGDANLQNSDGQGRMTICGNATIQNYSIGSTLIGLHDALRVGGNLAFINGTIYGNAVVAGTANMTSVTFASGGSLSNAAVSECATANAQLLALSSQYRALQPNGTVTFQFGVLTLTGSDTSTNIFALNAGQLATANTLQVTVPPGSSALINISGTTLTWQQMGIFLNGADESQVLYNFYEATNLTIHGISVRGSALAPKAAVQFNNGQINGSLVAASLSGFGQAHQMEFAGCVGPQPAPGPSPTPTSNVPPTQTPTRPPTSTPAPTDTPAPPTNTPLATDTPVPPAPTDTPLATATRTPTRTITQTRTPTSTLTAAAATLTFTPVPATSTRTPTATFAPATATGTPTATEPTPTPTVTETPPPPTPTPTPTATPCPNNALGTAADFNVFACGSANVGNSDVGGRMAVAGNASLTSYGIGSSLPASNGGRDDLIVGGSLTYNTGQVFAGNAVYEITASISNVGFPSGSLIQGMPVSFANECANLQQLSDNLCTLPGSNVAGSGNLQFSGANPSLNVFHVSAASLANAYSIQISAPANASVVINVTGGPAQIAHLGMTISGTDRSHVLWNFCGAVQLTISGVAVEGSVLAPYTNVTFNNGQVNGTLITRDLTGSGESHNYRFSGCGL